MNDSGALTVGAVEMKFSELLPESADRKSRFEIISFDDDQKIVAFHNRNNNQIIATEGNSVVGKNADEINGKLQIDWKASGFVLIPYLEPGQEIALWSSSSQTFVQMLNKTFHLATLEDKILPHELEFWRDWARFEVVNTSKTNGQISLYNKAHNKFVDVNEGIVAGRENITFYEQTLNVVTLVDGEIALQNSHFDSFLRMQGTVVNASRGELNRHLASYKFVVVANPRVRLPRDYVKFKTLGEGKTASVFEARNALDDGMYAVKYLTGNHATNRFTWQNELHMMGQLPMHPNIVRYFTATVFESRLFIVTELINGISLQAACTEYAAHRKFDEERMLSWAEQIASGLAALHARRILHRDFHTGNVLVKKKPQKSSDVADKNGHIPVEFEDGDAALKIIDFGLSVQLQENQSYVSVVNPKSLRHFSPERSIAGGKYNDRDDVWAMGYQFALLVTGRFLSELNDCGLHCIDFAKHPKAVNAVMEKVIEISPAFGKIVGSILHARDPKDRPSSAEVLKMIKKARNDR